MASPLKFNTLSHRAAQRSASPARNRQTQRRRLSVRCKRWFGVVTHNKYLRTPRTVPGVSILMAYNENPNLGVHVPINNGVGKTREREGAAVFGCWLPNIGKLFE
jgi:hypothetical protein